MLSLKSGQLRPAGTAAPGMPGVTPTLSKASSKGAGGGSAGAPSLSAGRRSPAVRLGEGGRIRESLEERGRGRDRGSREQIREERSSMLRKRGRREAKVESL